MRPVDQRIFGSWGNCLPACVASILEIPLDEVPLFHDPTSSVYVPQVVKLNAWLEPKGLYAMEYAFPWEATYMLPKDYYILCGVSPRRPHVVVAYGDVIVHDPHPSRAGLVSVDSFIVLGVLS
jgi:hypothetical protein